MFIYLKRKLKKLKFILGQDHGHLKPSFKLKPTWLGSNYGGFYVHTDFLDKNSVVYSVGVGEDISFDLAVISKFACEVFAFDPTPKSAAWLSQQEIPSNYRFIPIALGECDGKSDFYLPKNKDYVSGSLIAQQNVSHEDKIVVDVLTLKSLMEKFSHSKVDLLKIDIEGSEFELVDQIAAMRDHIGQLCIEFHDRFFPEGVKRSKGAIKILNEAGFEVFAVSDTYEEVSLVNRRFYAL